MEDVKKIKPLEENLYKPDFEIAGKYIDFSSEILRLALLAITGVSTFVILTMTEDYKIKLSPLQLKFFFNSILGFSLTAAATLFHKYFAYDSLGWQIDFLRKETKEVRTSWISCLRKAGYSLIVAELLFGYSVIALLIAFYHLML